MEPSEITWSRSVLRTRSRPRLRPAIGAAAVSAFASVMLLSILGCATGGVPLEELSERPIALVYWEPEVARRRQEIVNEMMAGPEGPPRRGVARMTDMARVLGGGDDVLYGSRLNAFPGRIVLLNPRTLELTAFPAAPPNARPLAWSDDHRRLLFSSQHRDGGISQLFEFDLDRGELKKLTHAPDFHLEGDYAPDGRLAVTFIRQSDGRPVGGLELRGAGGTFERSLFVDKYPSGVRWSPRGDVLVYVHADNREKRSETQRDESQIILQTPVPSAEADILASEGACAKIGARPYRPTASTSSTSRPGMKPTSQNSICAAWTEAATAFCWKQDRPPIRSGRPHRTHMTYLTYMTRT